MRIAARWSDNDRYYGPFTVSKNDRYNPISVVLSSADDEDRKCNLRISLFGWTVIARLPEVIKPYRRKVKATYWDAATIERMGRDWYYDIERREYGFTASEGHVSIMFGRQTNDSCTEQRMGWFIPWQQWRFVRYTLFDLSGKIVFEERGKGSRNWDARYAAEKAVENATFNFLDFDGEALSAGTHVEEHEWRFGEGWFKWLSLFRRPKIRRSLDIRFSGETGKRKGSWKGGTIGHSIDMLPDEMPEAAFRRYCAQNEMTFVSTA